MTDVHENLARSHLAQLPIADGLPGTHGRYPDDRKSTISERVAGIRSRGLEISQADAWLKLFLLFEKTGSTTKTGRVPTEQSGSKPGGAGEWLNPVAGSVEQTWVPCRPERTEEGRAHSSVG